MYDSARCIEALVEVNGWDYDEAVEWFNFNTLGACVGDATPLFVHGLVREEA